MDRDILWTNCGSAIWIILCIQTPDPIKETASLLEISLLSLRRGPTMSSSVNSMSYSTPFIVLIMAKVPQSYNSKITINPTPATEIFKDIIDILIVNFYKEI